jgi:hypothetical protein
MSVQMPRRTMSRGRTKPFVPEGEALDVSPQSTRGCPAPLHLCTRTGAGVLRIHRPLVSLNAGRRESSWREESETAEHAADPSEFRDGRFWGAARCSPSIDIGPLHWVQAAHPFLQARSSSSLKERIFEPAVNGLDKGGAAPRRSKGARRFEPPLRLRSLRQVSRNASAATRFGTPPGPLGVTSVSEACTSASLRA